MDQAPHYPVRRFHMRSEVEALKLWGFAITLALVAGGVYVAGVGIMVVVTQQ